MGFDTDNPPVGNYDVTLNDITKKTAKKVYPAWDPRNKKLGFGFMQDYSRGNPIRPEKIPNEERKIFEGIHTAEEQAKRQKQNKAPFLSTDFRFSYKDMKDAPPPPGSYQTEQDKWNTRTYNVLFTNL